MFEFEMERILETMQLENAEIKLVFEVFGTPLMFLVRSDNKEYLVYTLQERSIITKNKKRADIFEIVVGESTNETTSLVLNSKISIYEAFERCKKELIGRVGDKIFPANPSHSMDDFSDRFPKEHVMIPSF